MSALRQELVLTFPEALAVVERQAEAALEAARARTSETLPLLATPGRVLAEEISADRDLPPFPRSTRDGYALRAADTAGASAETPVELKVIGEIAAGASVLPAIGSRECTAIMTGAPVPESADAVIMVEETKASADGRVVQIQRRLKAQENIVPRGAEARRGQKLLTSGHKLDPAAIGLCAVVGRVTVRVFPRARVALLATGDELVEAGAAPTAHQVRNSNSYALAAQVMSAGALPEPLPIASDEADRLRELLAQGLEHDLLLVTGGVSAGKYDLVEAALAGFGAEFFFTGALIQPGRPIVFGRALSPGGRQTFFFGLPGNPVSALATFDVFVRPLLRALNGAAPAPMKLVQARLRSEVRRKPGLTRFLPAVLIRAVGGAEVELVPWQGSGDLVAAARANCYLVFGPECERLAAGEMATVFLAE